MADELGHAAAVDRARRRGLVLVVERDAQTRELEGCFLRTAGFAVELAGDGHAGLAMARQILPGLVVTELLMPRLDGLSLCRQLKGSSETRHIAVLVVSILASSARARDAGADAFLLKPLREDRLVETATRLLHLDPPHAPPEERA